MVTEPTTAAAVPIASPDGRIVASETPEGVEFRPAHRRLVQCVVAIPALGILMPVVVTTLAADSWAESAGPPLWFTVTCAMVFGGAGLAAGAYFWRFKAVPLVAQRSGRVTHGSRIFLEPGATRRLYVERVEDSDGPDHFAVVSENRWGRLVRFDTPYTDVFGTHDAACWFAARLGGVIGAEVVQAPN